MPRSRRHAVGGMVFHVLNRANGRLRIFDHAGDYRAFETILIETAKLVDVRLLSYCLMPNHWHLVVWPREDGDLSQYMHRLTTTHVRRWHLHRDSVGNGHLYQGAYKAFPVQTDHHFLTVCRYVERNAVAADLVSRAERWKWSSLSAHAGTRDLATAPMLSAWPVERPPDWVELVTQPIRAAELKAIRHASRQGRPYGSEGWASETCAAIGLDPEPRPPGRPWG